MEYSKYAEAFNAREEVLKWINSTLKNYLKTNPEVQDEIEHIIDYLSSEDAPKNILAISYTEAKSNAEKWLKTQIKKGNNIKELPEDTEVVLDFKDGFKIVKLIGENAYKREGFLMSHCVSGYFGNGKKIYSLRDKNNMPHCTLEKDQQIKGKGNGDIHPNYIEYIVKFLEFTGMTVGDNEMKHLGYVNIEDILEKEPDLVFPELYNKKYFKKDLLSKVENKDRISLWGKFNLFNFGKDMEVSFNFDFEKCREHFIEKFNSKNFIDKIINKTDNNEVAMTCYNEVAMTDNNEVAMTYNNKVAMTYNNEVAMTYNNEVAMDDYNEVAMTSSNKVAMTDNNEVAMTDNNEVAMTDNNEVVMTSCNKVAMTYNNKVAMTYNNEVAMTYNNEVAMDDYNEVAMTSSNKVAMTYNNKVAMTSYNEVVMTSSNKVAMTDNNEVVMTSYNKVICTEKNIIAGKENNQVECTTKNVIVLGNESKVKGKIGTLIVFYETDDDFNIINHKAQMIDGKKIKEDTWYKLLKGKIVEVE